MHRNVGFWIALSVFQIVFGLAVFAVTRDIYMADTDAVSKEIAPAIQRPLGQTNSGLEVSPAMMDLLTAIQPTTTDPVQISRMADEAFNNKNFARAAQLYEQLLAFDPGSAGAHNNLGLTLHYLGRSEDALRRLNEGATLDPGNQRIWLTLGFVNSQLGNVEEARKALTTAKEIGTNSNVSQSAENMLRDLR